MSRFSAPDELSAESGDLFGDPGHVLQPPDGTAACAMPGSDNFRFARDPGTYTVICAIWEDSACQNDCFSQEQAGLTVVLRTRRARVSVIQCFSDSIKNLAAIATPAKTDA
jgi:hypothetical protein